MTNVDKAARLRQNIADGIFPNGRTSFAESLLHQWDTKGSLSPKQWYWVDRICDEAEAITADLAKENTTAVGDMSGLIRLFGMALAKDVQRPKIKFEHNGTLIKLAYYPKMIYVTDVGHDAKDSSVNLAVITPDGILHKKREWKDDSLVDTIKELVEDPSKFGKAQGQRLKYCIFCSRPLTTTDSLFYGYGPVCAEKYMLEWGDAASHLMAEEVENLNVL